MLVEILWERVTVSSMVDDLPIEKEPSAPEGDLAGLPAPLGRMLFFLTIALLSSLALCWCLRRKASPPEIGTISGRPAPVVSDWRGRIERILVKTGDSVQVGDPIAVLVNEQLLLQIDRQLRDVNEIQFALHRAELTVDEELTRRLHAIDAEIVSRKTQDGLLGGSESESARLTPARLRVRELEALRMNAAHQVREMLGIGGIRDELARAEAKLRELQSQPQEIVLPAPVDGTIERVLRKPGERVVEGTPLLELADQDQPFLVVEMPESLAKRFALGDTIPLNFPGRESSIGRVSNMLRMEPKETGLSRRQDEPRKKVNVRLEIEPIDENWPEMPLESPVSVRTSDSKAMSRRIN